jgi:lipopolysaccharide transport system permease protein
LPSAPSANVRPDADGRGTSRARLRRNLDVLTVLATTDLQVRYGRGGLRVLKWLIDPLAALGVYLVLVAFIFNESDSDIGLSLACAIVPFQFVVTISLGALTAISGRSSIIVNMSFPRSLLPLSSVVTESVASAASLIMLPLMLIAYGVGLTASALWLPVALAATIVFAASLTYPFSLIGIWWPEYHGLVISLVRTMFFLAPGLVALDLVTGTTRELLPLNPLTGIFETFRDALLYGTSPAAWQILVPLGAAALLFAIFLPIYLREQEQLAKLVG